MRLFAESQNSPQKGSENMINLHNVSLFGVKRITIQQDVSIDGSSRWIKINLIPEDHGQWSAITVFADADGNLPTVQILEPSKRATEEVPLPAA